MSNKTPHITKDSGTVPDTKSQGKTETTGTVSPNGTPTSGDGGGTPAQQPPSVRTTLPYVYDGKTGTIYCPITKQYCFKVGDTKYKPCPYYRAEYSMIPTPSGGLAVETTPEGRQVVNMYCAHTTAFDRIAHFDFNKLTDTIGQLQDSVMALMVMVDASMTEEAKAVANQVFAEKIAEQVIPDSVDKI